MTRQSNIMSTAEIMQSLSNLSDSDFHHLFRYDDKKYFLDCQVELKKYLNTINKSDFFRSLDCNYYSCDQFNQKVCKVKTNIALSIIHVNIQSLNSKSSALKQFLQILELDFDLVVLSEIWSNNIDCYQNIFPGYTLYYDLPILSSVGGVGIYIKSSITCKIRSDLLIKPTMSVRLENIWLEITKNNVKYIIGGIYRHPSPNINDFNNLIEANLAQVAKNNVRCILVGDINIDFLKIHENKSISAYVDNLLLYNCLPVILLPTRITRSSATVIDHINYYDAKSNQQKYNVMSGNIFADVSDHLPNFFLLINNKKQYDYANRPFVRLHTEKNKTKFTNSIQKISWKDVLYNSKDVNVCYDTFVDIVKKSYEASFPLVRLSRKACHDKKWFTKGLRTSCKHKNLLFEKWLLTKLEVDKIAYLEYKRLYKKLVRKAELDFYSREFDNKVYSIKQLWSHLNTICSVKTNKKNSTVIDKLDYCGSIITKPNDISNAMNEYFCKVGQNLVNNVPPTSKTFEEYLPPPVMNSIYCEPVTTEELSGLIDSLNVNKSSGADCISSRIIKDNINDLVDPLKYIFNLSLEQSVVPDQMKIAKVVPIYKKDNAQVASNYRPISLLSILNKLLEQIVYKRIYGFVEKYQVLYKHQFGFRKNHSTTLAVLEIMDKCYKNLDEGKKVLGIYFDLQKAFDCISHDILLTKLENYGIRGPMHDWLKNYLHNRKQYTIVNNVSSNIASIKYGVPQGSVLGPLLFLIYVNDISTVIPDNSLKLFADDTNLFLFGKNLSELEQRANCCLEKMDIWFKSNKLSLNVDKTCYTLFTGRAPECNNSLNLLINGHCIKKAVSCKYLGLIIDERLKWDLHVEHVFKKLLKFAGLFYKLKSILPSKVLRQMYYAFVYPHILYGIEIYANTCQTTLDKLCKLNNKILRILQSTTYSKPTFDLYTEYNTLPIPKLFQLQILVFVHKCIYLNDSIPSVFQAYFTDNRSVHNHFTRRNTDLFVYRPSLTTGQKCTEYFASSLWNSLPSDLKNIAAPNIFKVKCKCYLASRY